MCGQRNCKISVSHKNRKNSRKKQGILRETSPFRVEACAENRCFLLSLTRKRPSGNVAAVRGKVILYLH